MLASIAPALATPRNSLVGRERDVAELVGLLRTGQERLVTLTGVGGCGKTRLALEVAICLREDFPDGVWLVELAPVSDARRVRQRVAAALSLSDRSEHGLLPSLQNRALLLVLDNCEHLVEACASMADQLLASCAWLRILATSREPLLIPGERQRRLAPLAGPAPGIKPAPETLADCPAVQLFVDRAQAVAPDFQLTRANAAAVARICTLLDGIPLAIELAAAQARVLAPMQLATHLRDCMRLPAGANRLAPTRQQTLRASLDWSYRLLLPAEQAVFRRLAVLAGHWSLEAAEAVCAGGGLATDVLPVVAALVDKSLVVAQQSDRETRYRLLEPVRQYAAQRLTESQEVESTHECQARYCTHLAERAERQLPTRNQYEWLRLLDAELDNIRAVLGRAEQRHDGQTILGIASRLYYFLWLRQHLNEGRHWFEAGLAGAEKLPVDLRARGLFGLTLMRSLVGENAAAEVVGQQAIDAYREERNPGGLALVLVVLAKATLARGDVERARRLAEDAIGYASAADDRWALGHALTMLGHVLHRRGESPRAVELQRQALTLFDATGDAWSRAYALASIGALRQPRASVARVAALAGVRWSWEMRDMPSLACALEFLAVYGDTENIAARIRLCAAAHTLRQSAGVTAPPGERDVIGRHLARARMALGEAAFGEVWKAGETMPLERIVASALAVPPSGSAPETRPGRGEGLTRREREVALLLIQGATDKNIACTLTITEGTAGLHVHHVLAKLGLRSRAQVAERAIAAGLVDAVVRDDPPG